ncbi:MAG: hypothetical protein KGY80_13000 [Candidatus Thorarchaeota archaeon]|nr:hypothetical protein [Candidatus Thorarchaeota archaeon]
MKEIIDKITLLVKSKVPFPIFGDSLEAGLSEIDFKSPAEDNVLMVVDSEGARHIFQRFVGDDGEIQYDEKRGRLRIISDNLDSLIRVSQRVMTLLSKIEGSSEIEWFELNYNSRILYEIHPMVRPKKTEDAGIHSLDEITGLTTQPYRKTICGFEGEPPTSPLNSIPTWLHMSIGPFVPNPRYFAVSFVYRRKELDEVIQLAENIPQVVQSTLNEMRDEEHDS